MDIEDLSKSQLLLLTILVNFVVSIATGVLTVSLLDEAPTTVTQTVNRIVDHTIETVTTQIPTSSGGEVPSTEDLLTAAISANSARTVQILRTSGETYLATGLYLSVSKVIVTTGNELPGHVTILFGDGTKVEVDRVAEDGVIKMYALPLDAILPSAPTAVLTPLAEVKQGQTAIGLSSDGSAVTGIVTKIDAEGITATLPGVPVGAAISNLSGAVIGIGVGGNRYLPADRINALLPSNP